MNVSPQIHNYEILTPKVMLPRRWGLREVVSHEVGALMNGLVPLEKLSHPFHHVRAQQEVCDLEESPHPTMLAP